MSIFQPEQSFAQYRLLKRIGVGGMATVFHAVDTVTSQEVALKVLHEQWSFDETIRKRFEMEAAIGSKLKHTGIVPIYSYGIDAERPYIVLKYMPGGNLADEFEKPRPVQLAVTGKLLTLLANALDYAHDKGVIHRDLKLDNILLDEKRRPAIADFGIAKLIGSTRLTLTGQLIGTPQYMAPELLDTNSDQQDKYVDLYAFAVMAYLMATGYFPFTAKDPFLLVLKHKRELAPVPTQVNPQLPRQMNPVLLRGLQKDPLDRYPSAREFAEAFNKALEDKGGSTTLIFMNELNPEQGEVIGDAPPERQDRHVLTPLLDAPDTAAFDAEMPLDTEQLALGGINSEVTVKSTALRLDDMPQVAPIPVKHKKRRGLLVAALILLLSVCGGSFALMQSGSLPFAFDGVSNLPTATPSDDADEPGAAAITRFEIALQTATALSISTIEAEISATVTAATSDSTATRIVRPTVTPGITRTLNPTATATIAPTNTVLPTNTVRPTNTATTRPTNTALPVPTNTSAPVIIPPRPILVIPTEIPVMSTAIQIIPTVINILPSNPITGGGGNTGGGGDTGGGDTGGDTGSGGDTSGGGDDGGIEIDLPVLPPITLPGLGL